MAENASVLAVENPNTDEITVAQSKVDVFTTFVKDSDDELVRIADKIAKTKEQLAAAQEALKTAKEQRQTRLDNLSVAQEELKEARTISPELAARIDANNALMRAHRREELMAELADLEKGN